MPCCFVLLSNASHTAKEIGFLSSQEDVDNLLCNMLNQREQEIIRLHYGLDGKAISLSKISHRYGIENPKTKRGKTD